VGLYESLFEAQRKNHSEQHNQHMHDIQKDLDRTMPSIAFFRTKEGPGQQALDRMLSAVAFYHKKLGYVQGMNFMAAALLLNFESIAYSDSQRSLREEVR